MSETTVTAPVSDAELIARVRSGETRAFGILWERHYRPAYRAALQFARTTEPDDVLSEAYLRVYQQLLMGRGPTTAFRPYLYSVIRNVAITWQSARAHDVTTLEEDPEDLRIPAEPEVAALDRSLTSRAFRSLPDRWQTVLWYTEIEGMDPQEVGPILGLSANGVAALALRAREGLRQAWLQEHVNDRGTSPECQWAITKMGGHVRKNLGPRDQNRLDAHLAECTKCLLVSSEVEEVGSRLALVMLPIILGGAAGIGLLDHLSNPSVTNLADAVMPSLPQATEALAQSEALALPIVGTFSLVLLAGRRARLIGIAGAVILLGSLLLGIARSVESNSVEPPPPSNSTTFEP